MAAATLSTRHSVYYGLGSTYQHHRDHHGQGYLYGESTSSSRHIGGSGIAGTERSNMPPRSASGYSRSKLSGYSVKKEQSTRSHGKIYYRLLTYSLPYSSLYPLDTEDDSLSFIHEARLPAQPRAQDVLSAICAREGIHISRAKLYTYTSRLASGVNSIKARSAYAYAHPDTYTLLTLSGQGSYSKRTADGPQYILADPDTPLTNTPGLSSSLSLSPLSSSSTSTFQSSELNRSNTHDSNTQAGPGTRSGSRAAPLVLFLDVDPSRDRTHAAFPAGALERRGRQVAKAVRRGAAALEKGLGAVFGVIQMVPKGMEQ